MKFLIRFVLFFMLTVLPVKAVSFDVLVIPADLFQTKENYYGFDEASEIFANDIIYNFGQTNGKIKSPDLYEVRRSFVANPQLKLTAQNALSQYKNDKTIDYSAFKTIGKDFKCNSILIVSSSVLTNKNSVKRGVWEVLDISSAFEILYPYRLETSVVLLDIVNDLVMWSNNYSTKLGSNSNVFSAKNYAQANAQYEKLDLYSKTVLAPSASQNIMLRFFPKTIRTIEKETVNPSGGALRFERTLPDKPQDLRPKENFYGDMMYGI